MNLLILLLLIVLNVFPLIFLLKNFIMSDGRLDLSIIANIWEQSLTLTSIKNSMLICSLTVVLSCLMAMPIAWLLTRSDIRFKKNGRKWKKK